MRLKVLLVAAAVLPAARADVKPHPLFSDHMVLQRDAEVPVWGKADPGEKVSVTLAAADEGAVVAVTAGADGVWKATLPKRPAGTGFTLTVKGNNTVTFKNVAVGDVWVCSGQSNMQWEFWRLDREGQGTKVSAAAANPNVRLFTVPRRPSAMPEYDFPVVTQTRDADHKVTFGTWQECTPDNVLEFSAVGYYFGREIEKSQHVPVGLLASNWGGTLCEAWTSKEALAADPKLAYLADNFDKATKGYDDAKADAEYKAAMEKWRADAAKAKEDNKTPPRQPTKLFPGGVHQNTPTALYNGMIHPLLPFPVRGAIWYQGESNSGRAAEYYTLFPAMIQDWRARWGTDLPFFAVQLAPYQADGPAKVSYAELRDAQWQATKLPKVGAAVITDVGEEIDIHPQRKGPVGTRLALAARALAYGENVEYRGPVFQSLAVEGSKAVVTFDHADGLTAGYAPVHGFAVCGEDEVFYPAAAQIKGVTVVVTSAKVAKPVAVRFGWVNFAVPTLNLFNKAGLPAVPFRTDDFPLTTARK